MHFADHLADIAQSLRAINVTLKELTAFLSTTKRVASTEAEALALLIQIGPNIAEIAERLGVHRSTLYRWPKFMEQVGRVRRAGVNG
jgi:DNA-binding MarR family transcriptional regulator